MAQRHLGDFLWASSRPCSTPFPRRATARKPPRPDGLIPLTRTRSRHGKRKKAPETEFRKPSLQVWRLTENHFRESQSRVSTRFYRCFGEQIFFAQLRQRHAVTFSNDALRAAIADACPCGKPARGHGATTRKGRAQMEYFPRHLYATAAPWGVDALAFPV